MMFLLQQFYPSIFFVFMFTYVSVCVWLIACVLCRTLVIVFDSPTQHATIVCGCVSVLFMYFRVSNEMYITI